MRARRLRARPSRSRTARGRTELALVSLLLAGCPAELAPPSLTVAASPIAIDDQGAAATITVTATAAGGAPGEGAVSLSSAAGSLKGGTSVSLDGEGKGTAAFACALAADPACSGAVQLSASWSGLTATTRVRVGDAGAVTRPDAGPDGGALDGGGDDAGAGDGGASDSGSPDAGQDAGRPFVADAGAVLLLGTLTQPPAPLLAAVATLDAPDAPMVGLPSTADLQGAQLTPDGRLVYIDELTGQLKVAVPDAYQPSGTGSQYPPSPGANDRPLPTPACDAGSAVSAFWVRPGTAGAVVYRCGGDLDYFEGTQTLTALHGLYVISVGYDGVALASTMPFADYTVDDAGVRHGVFGFMGETLYPLSQNHRWREVRSARDGGFLLTLPVPAQLEPCNIWRIAPSGQASLFGTFVGLPGGAAATLSCTGRIDGDGVLFTPGRNATDDVVARRPAFPGGGTVIYSERDAGASSFASFPPSVFTFVEPGTSALVSAP